VRCVKRSNTIERTLRNTAAVVRNGGLQWEDCVSCEGDSSTQAVADA
jgi:hypothetical protein